MNIFYLDNDAKQCAKDHCDKHVVKMSVEYTQILSTVLHKLIDLPQEKWQIKLLNKVYKPTHQNHPAVLWAEKSFYNFKWLLDLANYTGQEYTVRYEKIHKSSYILDEILMAIAINFSQFYNAFPSIAKTPPPQIIPEQYKHRNPVKAYRDYYFNDKGYFAKWKMGNTPKWWNKYKEIPECLK